jgi:hypothetical protein
LSHSAASDANRAAVTCAFAFRKASRGWRTSAFSLCIAASGPSFAGKRIGFRDTDRFDLAATFLAPQLNRPSVPDDQESVGFDGDFGPFSANHRCHQSL